MKDKHGRKAQKHCIFSAHQRTLTDAEKNEFGGHPIRQLSQVLKEKKRPA
jgi:hypothetical protein